jgi:hypothetical protein
MEQQAGGPNFELPAEPTNPELQTGKEQAVEAPPARQERVGEPERAPALPAMPDDIPSADQPVITTPPQDAPPPAAVGPKAVAADTDNIEREWVDKVKDVVARTQEDPHLQKEQMSRVKAEYIQKRFNKTIKTDEARA